MKIERLVFFVDGTELIIRPTRGLHIHINSRYPYEKVTAVRARPSLDFTVFTFRFGGIFRRQLSLLPDKATELREWLTKHEIEIRTEQ